MDEQSALDALGPVLAQVKPYMMTLAVTIARPVALIATFPVFTFTQNCRIVRTGVAVALVLPVFDALHEQRLALFAPEAAAASVAGSAFRLTLLGLKEFAVGFLLALLLAIPFWAI